MPCKNGSCEPGFVLTLTPHAQTLSLIPSTPYLPTAVTASTGVPAPALLELLSRSLGLVALPSPLLCAALEGLAADLGVAPEHVAALMAQQPTLLCAQVCGGWEREGPAWKGISRRGCRAGMQDCL